ncbi:MAG: hypothetical protein WCO61_07180 [Alphaproteobacteria bacterium]
MPLINFSEPMTFCDTVEAAAVILQICLTRLRDEAAYRDDDDHGPLYASQFLISMLEDALKESEALSTTLEIRLRDNTRTAQ